MDSNRGEGTTTGPSPSNTSYSTATPMFRTTSVIKVARREPRNIGHKEDLYEPSQDDEKNGNVIQKDKVGESSHDTSREETSRSEESVVDRKYKFNKVVPDQAATKKQSGNTFIQRNAWGNLSYADLITRAIMSSPDKRMTLQEIYSWISTNVPYFMDKKDGPTTTGWKNSVRHTLSIRKRFIRLPNIAFGSLNYKSLWTVDTYAEVRRRRPSHQSPGYHMESQRNEMVVNLSQPLRVWTSQPLDRATQTEFPTTWCPHCRHVTTACYNTGIPLTLETTKYQS